MRCDMRHGTWKGGANEREGGKVKKEERRESEDIVGEEQEKLSGII